MASLTEQLLVWRSSLVLRSPLALHGGLGTRHQLLLPSSRSGVPLTDIASRGLFSKGNVIVEMSLSAMREVLLIVMEGHRLPPSWELAI